MGLHHLPDLGWCTQVPQGIRLTVQITPNAKKSEVVGVLGDALKIKLQAQPIEGKANEALVRFLARALNVPRSIVTIAQGQTSRRKSIEIKSSDLTVDAVTRALSPVMNRAVQ